MIAPTAMAKELHRLVAGGYIQAVTGQAAVWHEAINDAVPRATNEDLREVVRKIMCEPHQWLSVGDIIASLRGLRSKRITAAGPQPTSGIYDISHADEMEFQRVWRLHVGDGMDRHDAIEMAYAAIDHDSPQELTQEQAAANLARLRQALGKGN